jgi:hypothetical protein
VSSRHRPRLTKQLFVRGPGATFALPDVFASLSPKVFVAILNDPVMCEPGFGSRITTLVLSALTLKTFRNRILFRNSWDVPE